MVNLYIAPCGKGKTHKLNEIYDEKKKIKNNLCLFFPSGSEIISLIKGNENKTNNLKYPNNLSIILDAYINQKITEKEKNQFDQLINSRIKAQKDAVLQWKKLYEKQSSGLSSLIKDYDLNSYSFELPKLTINTKTELSVGSIWYYHISLCLDLLKNEFANNQTNFIIFIDEPESFMHPDWIKKVALNIVEISQNSDIKTEFYIASHSPMFISSLVNNIGQEIYINTHQNDKWKTLKNPINQFCSTNKILYEIYHVHCIEFLDELIGELEENSNYCFTKADDSIYKQDSDVICFNTPHTLQDGSNKYTHWTYISFARNYFHHPEQRENYQKFITAKNISIDDILDKAIKNAICILKKMGKYSSLEL